MFEICGITPLFSECNVPCYSGIAFDGCCYYLTVKDTKKIMKADGDFHMVKSFSTSSVYSSICYDSYERCFWVVSNEHNAKLIKLDYDFKELDQICLQIEPSRGTVSSIAYDCANNSLIISMRHQILSIDKAYPQEPKEIVQRPHTFITGVTGISPCYLYHYINGAQKLCFISEDGTPLGVASPPKGHKIEQILYLGRFREYDHFQMLTLQQGSYPFIIEAKMSGAVLGKLRPCNYLCDIDKLFADKEERKGCDCKCDCECKCKTSCLCSCSCSKVLEAIALEEAAIARILNAEGEKIQQAIATSNCIAELLKVNQEVNRTIIYVTNLEQVLYAKLDTVLACCGKCTHKGKNHCTPSVLQAENNENE